MALKVYFDATEILSIQTKNTYSNAKILAMLILMLKY